MLVLDDDSIFAEWTLLEVLQASRFDFLPLLDTIIEFNELGREKSSELRLGKEQLAARLIHANDIGVVFSELSRRV